MSEIMVSTDLLKKSVSNVRAGHTKEDIAQMANSIRHRGIINAPTVALNGDGKYEIIAGQLRVAGAIAAGVEEVRCLDVTALTDAERVALSLSENFDRAEMGALETYKAFAKLFKAGLSVDDIAEQFSTSPRSVQRMLAIGTLPKKILDAAEANEIGSQTLEALAIAAKADVVRYSKLKPKERPNDWQIKDWLYGEKGAYPASAAIFDLADYKGPKITDLFGEEDQIILTDGEEFWKLQNAEVEATLETLKKNDWKCTELDYFSAWEYEKVAKKDGGQVFYTIDARTGRVAFYKGYKKKGRTGAAPAAKGDTKPTEKPEIAKTFADFMAETRHAAVAHHLFYTDVTNALKGTLMLLLRQCDNISFRNGGKPLSDAYSDSLHSSDSFIQLHDSYTEMLTELNLRDGHLWDIDLEELGKRLDEYKPAQIRDWIILFIAYNWSCENPANGDAIGKAIGLTQVNLWEADDAFWNGITNKKTLIAIAKETGVPIDVNATAKVTREILKEKVPSDWRPKWLFF